MLYGEVESLTIRCNAGRLIAIMIAFDLECRNGHTFEGWFEDSRAYEEQQARNLIACPICETTEVAKKFSTFAIKSSQQHDATDKAAQMAALSNEIAHFVENNFDNVGADFAAEALKIHYGVTEPRNIRGVSTDQEEKILQDEGIKFFKFPVPKPPDADA